MTTPARTRRVLLTVSGIVDADVADRIAGDQRPLPDYVAMADAMDADILDVAEARRRTGRVGRLVERIGGPAALLAWTCFRERRSYGAVFTDGEQVGLPLALLCRLTARRPFAHVMIVHILSVPKKYRLYRAFRLGRYVDTMVVYSTAQRHFVRDALGFPGDRVLLTPFTVDTAFFAPGRVESRPGPRPVISSAGLEFRDYPTLMQAVRGLEARVVIAAASPWSTRPDSTAGAEVPDNVEICRLGFVDLRQLYADSDLVVMPLYDTDFQAGVTTILEAMAMGKAIVCSRTRGQTDVVVDDENGVYVEPGDPSELRTALEGLLDDPARARRLGEAGRDLVVRACDVKVYAHRLAAAVDRAVARHGSAVTNRPDPAP
jgi:glycosyltransferase involved in cell wall biosynthesis